MAQERRGNKDSAGWSVRAPVVVCTFSLLPFIVFVSNTLVPLSFAKISSEG
jgi:hypothetical protein